jgi:hypothetical protein
MQPAVRKLCGCGTKQNGSVELEYQLFPTSGFHGFGAILLKTRTVKGLSSLANP